MFTVSNVNRGQFLVGGSPATSFTQADITAGLVAFAHDNSEFAPSYEVTVSDGTTSFGPQAPTVNFTNVNDNSPIIVPGQLFEVSESSVTNTVVGSVDADDVDLPGDQLGFEIIAGNDDGVFAIDNNGVHHSGGQYAPRFRNHEPIRAHDRSVGHGQLEQRRSSRSTWSTKTKSCQF